MALVDLTNVNPWKQEVEATKAANRQRQAALQGAIQAFQSNLNRGVQRRQQLDERNQAIRDREYALINQETDALIQPQTNSKITDVQLQQVGQQMKQEYYDAVKAYEGSDKGDEARQSFEEAKSKALSSARVVGGALDKLSTQVETFRAAYNNGGISDALNPNVRAFMADLIDPQTPSDKYQIITDPETNQLKYIDTATGGEDVNFFLDDIANGENAFAPLPKANMPKIIDNLMKDVNNITKQEKRDWGVAEITDWSAMGEQIDGRLEQLLTDNTQFKVIAAGLGYGYEEFQNAAAGVPYTDEDGREITNIDDLKMAVKEEIMQQVESVTPHQEKRLYEHKPQTTLAQQAEVADNLEKQQNINSDVAKALGSKDIEYFKKNLIGIVPNVDNVVFKDGKLVLASGFGKKAKVEQVFDLSSTSDKFRLTELFGGNRNLAELESNIIDF